MEPPSMDTVYQAINALYNNNPNAAEKEKASIWLAEVQKSIHSWKIADELLQQKKDITSCYFAAQTMRAKVQHNLSELPAEAVVSLRDSLVSHLEISSPNTNTAILTQLCLALADLALQTPTWSNCVSDLIKLFSNKNDFALLEILTVLPQEIDSLHLKLGENRREDIKAELRANSHIVTLFLNESLNSSQKPEIALKIVKCMTSWIQVKAINIQEVPQNAVIGFSLQILRDHNSINILHDAASDCICAILHSLEDNNNNDEVERLLFDSISVLEESYHMAVAHEEEEKAVNYARVFTELAETFLEKIIVCTSNGNAHFAMRSLELALVCVGHHDYEVAEITFNLWYRLSEEVYQRDYEPLTDAFKPHIERLIEALARHCQCEPDYTKLPEEGDEFHEFRMKVTDLIKDVVFMVGSGAVFRQMFAALQTDASWEHTEAALFVMQAVAKNILPEEYEYVPKVVEAILSMPETAHVAVRKTCILVLGELGDWLQRHSAWLQPVLQALLRALQVPALAPAAAAALQNICAVCRSAAATHVQPLLEAARLADSLRLSPSAGATLMRALAAAIGRLPPDQLELAMRSAASVQLSGLAELARGEDRELRKGSSTDPAVWLDRLAALFRDVDVQHPPDRPHQHPCMPAFHDAWPVIRDVMNKVSAGRPPSGLSQCETHPEEDHRMWLKLVAPFQHYTYQADGRVMERACRCVRFAVRATGRAATDLLPEFVRVLPAIYAAKPHPCILYLTAVFADALVEGNGGGGGDAASALAQLLHALLPRALALLSERSGLRDNPDTVDDLYRLCIRYLQRIPVQLVQSGALPAVLQCSLRAVALDHREANSSVMKFLYDLLRAATRPHLSELVNEPLAAHAEELTFALLEASVIHLHAHMLAEVAEVMLELLIWQKARGQDWLQGALARLPRAPATAAAATEHQCWQFHQYAMRAEKCKEMTRLLRDFARLYR